MAQKKVNKDTPTASKKPSDTETQKRRPVRMAESKKKREEKSALLHQILPFVFYVSALLVLLVLVLSDTGIIVTFMKNVLLGMLSFAAFTIPILLVLLGVFWRSSADGRRIGWKFWCSLIVAAVFTVLIHVILNNTANYSIPELYAGGIAYDGGGVIGGLIGSLFLSCFGQLISIIILGAVLFVLSLLLFGLTPNAIYHMIKGKAVETRDRRRQLAEEGSEADEDTEMIDIPPAEIYKTDPSQQGKERKRGKKFDPDVDMSADRRTERKAPNRPEPEETDQDAIDAKIFDEVQRRTYERYGEQNLRVKKGLLSADTEEGTTTPPLPIKDYAAAAETGKTKKVSLPPVAESDDDGELDLSKIFVDPEAIELLRRANERAIAVDRETGEVLDAERSTVSEPEPRAVTETVPEPEPEYEFPPLTLLAEPKAATAANIDELKDNAQKLIDTLRSFNVKTKISDVFHGPTITRYELTPESGTRVRAIANLSDDIALSLAAPGVRIEAPIPGKAAVGVEVPNRVRENVVLRGLLENDEFVNSDSRLLTALGSDVAGAPVYCDISKMPHLLVAGATGMGKSVCINSIVVSMLYKARPDEVRLIMIDPKKVEFGVYNGIPHLHVPVVNDPKKAAGTLAWAVGEMDRRYGMIEGVGVRNIQGYNEVTKGDPEKPFMPYMVIIIDELADLMMTAPDDVETHICRIAQMGRAAGMHLIIGTQRPSVDVITGLIKANIPSRISCKTSSQVDSRTIIDSVGAEKLLGRGDMLYAPVGVMKPQRVQGAFVSDSEVEKITDFLKGICPSPHYDEDAIDGIEEAARQCGTGKKGGGRAADDGDAPGAGDDPMLRQALELAVDSGKISTSLIQRRLSLGYGRAAKLIDRMEALGYVSAPDGQRPREVLITRQQFQELVLRDEFN